MDASRVALLERLAVGPERIAACARAAGRVAPGGERWTARQNVAHLVLVERQVFQVRLDDLTAGEPPRWDWTEPSTSDAPDVATLELALAAFAEARGATQARVIALDEVGWARFGHHATYGRLDVAALLGVIVDHDDHHRADLAALASAAGTR